MKPVLSDMVVHGVGKCEDSMVFVLDEHLISG